MANVAVYSLLLRINFGTAAFIEHTQGKFVLMSDSHYDPFYGTTDAYKHTVTAPCKESNAPPFSTQGCDSSRALVRSTVANAAKVLPDPDFILFLGDATRHGASMVKINVSDVVLETIDLVPSLVQEYYGNVPLLSMPPLDLGNNDFLDDYTIDVTSQQACLVGQDGSLPSATNDWLRTVAETYRSYFVSEEEAAVFACGGYFVRQVTGRLAIIVLNTVLWSSDLQSDYSLTKIDITDPAVDPFGQHAWLNYTLADLQDKGIKAYVTGHIPPVLMSYSSNVGEPMMYEWHMERYYQTLAQYTDSAVVAGQIFGHIHTSELRATPLGEGMTMTSTDDKKVWSPIITTGSISPCYQSNPIFMVVEYDHTESQSPIDLTTYVAPLNGHYTTFVDDETKANPDEQGVELIQFEKEFDSLIDFFFLQNALSSSSAIQSFASKLLVEDVVWNNYYNVWRKGQVQQPECVGACRLRQACIVGCGSHATHYNDCLAAAKEVSADVPTVPNFQCTLTAESYQTYLSEDSLIPFRAKTFLALVLVVIAIISIIGCMWCFQKWRRRRLIRQGMTRINDVYLEELDINYDDENSITSDTTDSKPASRRLPSLA